MNIKTLGFRGEALASIASIAEVSISSATRESKEGYQIECKNGDLKPIRPTGMAPGTIVEVRNLFYTIPARRKFLKAKATEMAHITETVTQLALSAFGVSFKLTHNGKTIFCLTGAEDPKLRIKQLLGTEEVDFIRTERSSGACKLDAYLGLPCYSRSSNKWQYCYINGRAIKDRVALRSLQDAYQDYLPNKRFAIAVLYLTLDPSYVDVNVHPAKAEVRYRESKEIYEIVFKAVSQGLRTKDVLSPLPIHELTSENSFVPKQEDSANCQESLAQREEKKIWQAADLEEDPKMQSNYEKEADESKKITTHQSNTGFAFSDATETYPKQFANFQHGKVAVPQENPFLKRHLSGKQSRKTTPLPEHKNYSFWDKADGKEDSKISSYLQINKTYLVVESKEGLIVIDQHAFHERVLYNRIRTQIQKGKIPSQPLLFPEILHLSVEEIAAFLEWQKDLQSFGIETKCVGNTVEIHSFPHAIGKASAKEIVADLILQSEDRKQLRLEDAIEKVLATMACKAAVKAGESLSKEEIESLLKIYEEEKDNIYFCPHGRPTVLKISIPELEKHFKRT